MAAIIIDSNHRIRTNPRSWVFLCFPPNSNFRRKIGNNVFKKFCSYAGAVIKDSGYGIGLSSLKVPYTRIHAYRVKLYNGKWDNKNVYQFGSISKNTYEYRGNTSWLVNRYFEENSFKRNLIPQEINAIKNFNNYDKMVKKVKFDNSLSISEYAYFLYDNLNIIKETFISQINKNVSLIGSIYFFSNVKNDGRMSLINNQNKLLFRLKSNKILNKLSFNLSPTVASQK